MDAARLLSEERDLRRGLCVAARALLRADLVALWEPRADGLLEVTATSAPVPPAGGLLVDADGGSLTALAFREDRRVFAPRLDEHHEVAREIARRLGLRSVLAQPVRRLGDVVAVLVVAWRTAVAHVPEELTDRLELLAAGGGVALHALQRAARLEQLALTDALTGLPNRRHLEAHLHREVARAGRRGTTLGVATFDVDDLKEVNDREGHQAGDALLRSLATTWRTRLRAGDLLARTGGDEFVLVLPDCGDLAACAATVERVRVAGGDRASAGVATWAPGEAPEALLERADAALYQAKREGRRRTVTAAGG